MQQRQDKTTEVLIVGAGPTGLMMACQLAIHQVSFRIIDKNDSPLKYSGALIVQARSLEIFEKMGIAQEACRDGIIANKVNVVYNGRKIASTGIKDIGRSLSPFPFLLMLEQSETEKLFLKFISEHGHSVERCIRFKSFIQENTGVISVVILPDGSETIIKSKYVIAADGARSTIRNFLNIPFTGLTYPKPLFTLDCNAKTDLYPGEIYFAFSKNSIAGFFPLKGFRWRIDSTLPKELERSESITIDFIKKNFQDWAKMNFTLEDSEWFSVSHAHRKYARSICVRNCYLAGDAAHIHTPVGAQGMNTGLQDAMNLAWKLAFVIKNKAKPELLATYSAERLGVSEGFARSADAVFKFVTSRNVIVVFFRLFILKVLIKFLFPMVENRKVFRQMFFKSISQIGIHYRDSILSSGAWEGKFLRGAPRPGDRMPYVEFLYQGIKTDNYKLIDIDSFNLFVLADVLPREIKIIAEKYKIEVKLITCLPETKKIYQQYGIKHTGYYLIRPDMHIALRSATLNAPYLNTYLQKFLRDE
jgi:2-polyprenyl-6-methoxyphenol hydroxylase-like FAD-dependent oxidoreductase